MVNKMTKFGPASIKEDLVLADDETFMFMDAWEDEFKKLESGKAYTLSHLIQRKVGTEVKLSTSFSTVVKAITVKYKPISSYQLNIKSQTIEQFVNVRDLSISYVQNVQLRSISALLMITKFAARTRNVTRNIRCPSCQRK